MLSVAAVAVLELAMVAMFMPIFPSKPREDRTGDVGSGHQQVPLGLSMPDGLG